MLEPRRDWGFPKNRARKFDHQWWKHSLTRSTATKTAVILHYPISYRWYRHIYMCVSMKDGTSGWHSNERQGWCSNFWFVLIPYPLSIYWTLIFLQWQIISLSLIPIRQRTSARIRTSIDGKWWSQSSVLQLAACVHNNDNQRSITWVRRRSC